MTNKKLTPSEILRALADGKIIQGDCYLFKLSSCNQKLTCSYNYTETWESSDHSIDELLELNCTIHTPPEPKKNLIERFAEHFGVELTYDAGHLYTSHDGNTLGDIAYWLDKQPESRLKEND